jgi:hypothetical protein
MNLTGLMGYVYWVCRLMRGCCGRHLGMNALHDSARDVAAVPRNVPKHMLSPPGHELSITGDISPCVLSHGGPAALAIPKPHAIPSP